MKALYLVFLVQPRALHQPRAHGKTVNQMAAHDDSVTESLSET